MRAPMILYEPRNRARTDYRVGLSAWTDKSMLAEGQFYPRKTMTAEDRLWWYSRYFDVVEVNSSVYAIPSIDTTKLWVERTPTGFLFNVKAYGLLTGHHVDTSRTPEALQTLLSRRLRKKASITASDLPSDARAWAFGELRPVLAPLADAGKLGYVLFQLAPWVKASDEARADLAGIPKQLPGIVIAVEFRHRSWFGMRTDDTLRFLRDHGLGYVSIDGPRSRATVPSLPALTCATAVFRLHGRNITGFLKQVQGKAPTVAEKYDYLYTTEELEEVARQAGALNGKAERVHLAMNNNRGDYPAINGIALKRMLLEDWHPPDRDALVEELSERRATARPRSAPRATPSARQQPGRPVRAGRPRTSRR